MTNKGCECWKDDFFKTSKWGSAGNASAMVGKNILLSAAFSEVFQPPTHTHWISGIDWMLLLSGMLRHITTLTLRLNGDRYEIWLQSCTTGIKILVVFWFTLHLKRDGHCKFGWENKKTVVLHGLTHYNRDTSVAATYLLIGSFSQPSSIAHLF